jgi:hypothetical protein
VREEACIGGATMPQPWTVFDFVFVCSFNSVCFRVSSHRKLLKSPDGRTGGPGVEKGGRLWPGGGRGRGRQLSVSLLLARSLARSLALTIVRTQTLMHKPGILKWSGADGVRAAAIVLPRAPCVCARWLGRMLESARVL